MNNQWRRTFGIFLDQIELIEVYSYSPLIDVLNR